MKAKAISITREGARVLLMQLRSPLNRETGFTYTQQESIRTWKSAIWDNIPEYMQAFEDKSEELEACRRAAIRKNDAHALNVVALDDQEYADDMATGVGAERVEIVIAREDFGWAQEHIKNKTGLGGDDDSLDILHEIATAFEKARNVKVVNGEVLDDEVEEQSRGPLVLNRRARRAAGRKAR